MKITTSGPLHNQPARAFRQGVGKALDSATNQTLGQVRAITPVDTGRLRRGWEAPRRAGWDRATLTNEAPYYRFVAARIDLTGRAETVVSRELERALGNEIPRALN